jgi:hypothetical protein
MMRISADIVVCGGSLSACAAALQAARDYPKARILLTEITDWLGGQATSQGVSAIDNAWHSPAAALMRENPDQYYAADYLDFIRRIKNTPKEAPGFGYGGDGVNWVSREGYDPRSAAWILDQMIAEHSNIQLLKMTVVKAVQAVDEPKGRRITGLTLIQRSPATGYAPFDDFLSAELPDWYDPKPSHRFAKQLIEVSPADPARGMVVIDATELGDVMVLSGAVYTVGRELTTEKYALTGEPPAMDESGSQAFVFPFCETTSETVDAEEEPQSWWPDFGVYFQQQFDSFFSLGNFSWERVWSYRRLYTTGPGNSFDTVYPGDVTMENWNPGNDYPYGTLFKTQAEAAAEIEDWRGGVLGDQLSMAEKHAVAFHFYMKQRRTTTFDVVLARDGMPQNMMATKHGLSKFPYLRCTRRLVGLNNFRIQSREFTDTRAAGYVPGPSFRYYDAVGIGNYASDVHPTRQSKGLSPKVEQPAPFYIPYRSLASDNVGNLLVAGKNIAATYLTNSAYRLHPIEWAAGSAAGAAAAKMQREQLGNRDLLQLPRLRELQVQIAANSPIHWAAYDATPIPDRNGDLIINDLKPAVATHAFPIEIHHPAATRAELWLLPDGILLGETSFVANGALYFEAQPLPAGNHLIEARLYGPAGDQIDSLQASLLVEARLAEPIIVDNFEHHFSASGDWSIGNVHTDRYGLDYHHIPATGTPDAPPTAKGCWTLPIPHAGTYRIQVWYPTAPDAASDVPFTIHHGNTDSTIRVDQTKGGGTWRELGLYEFPTVAGARITVGNNGGPAGANIYADAVRLVPID